MPMSDSAESTPQLRTFVGAAVISSIGIWIALATAGVEKLLKFNVALSDATYYLVTLRPEQALSAFTSVQAHWLFWYGVVVSFLPFTLLLFQMFLRMATVDAEPADNHVDDWERENL